MYVSSIHIRPNRDLDRQWGGVKSAIIYQKYLDQRFLHHPQKRTQLLQQLSVHVVRSLFISIILRFFNLDY
jgi:hypothetical protein